MAKSASKGPDEIVPPKDQSPSPGEGPAASVLTTVNSLITDSITQINTKVLGDAPVVAMGNLFQATEQALENAAHNAANSQQQSVVTTEQDQAVTALDLGQQKSKPAP
jgi:Killing trait